VYRRNQLSVLPRTPAGSALGLGRAKTTGLRRVRRTGEWALGDAEGREGPRRLRRGPFPSNRLIVFWENEPRPVANLATEPVRSVRLMESSNSVLKDLAHPETLPPPI
jgi:hypothetical protein